MHSKIYGGRSPGKSPLRRTPNSMLNPTETVLCSAPRHLSCMLAVPVPLQARRGMAGPSELTGGCLLTPTGRARPTTGLVARWYPGRTGQVGCGTAPPRSSVSTTARHADTVQARMAAQAEVLLRPATSLRIPSFRMAGLHRVTARVVSSMATKSSSCLRNQVTPPVASERQQSSQGIGTTGRASGVQLSAEALRLSRQAVVPVRRARQLSASYA